MSGRPVLMPLVYSLGGPWSCWPPRTHGTPGKLSCGKERGAGKPLLGVGSVSRVGQRKARSSEDRAMVLDGFDLLNLREEAREVASAWGEVRGSFLLLLLGLQGENGTPWPPRTKGKEGPGDFCRAGLLSSPQALTPGRHGGLQGCTCPLSLG